MPGRRARLARIPLARRWEAWLATAVSEEEAELEEVIHPAHGRGRDVAVAGAMLVVVVVASVAMEQAATRLGTRFAIPPIIIGGVVLAAVTSLPNSVAAAYLAARGRGAAMLSTTLNSNALNVTAGLLLPATITGLGAPSGQADLIAVWYLVLTSSRWRSPTATAVWPAPPEPVSSGPTWCSSARSGSSPTRRSRAGRRASFRLLSLWRAAGRARAAAAAPTLSACVPPSAFSPTSAVC